MICKIAVKINMPEKMKFATSVCRSLKMMFTVWLVMILRLALNVMRATICKLTKMSVNSVRHVLMDSVYLVKDAQM